MVGDGAIARAGRSSPIFPRAVNQKERLLVAVGKPLSLEPVRAMGELMPEQTPSSDRPHPNQYQFEGQAGEVVSVQVTSNDFDALLSLEKSGEGVESDDDTLGNTDPWLVVTLPETGSYTLSVEAVREGEAGSYEIRWQRVDPAMVEVYQLHRAGLAAMREKTGKKMREGIVQFEAALAIAQKLQDDYVMGRTAFFLGFSYNELSDYTIALGYYETALERFQRAGEQAWVASTLNNLGYLHTALGNTQQAMEYYQQALTLNRQLGDRHGEATSLGNLGSNHEFRGLMNDALNYYQQSRRIFQELGDSGAIATILNNIGSIYSRLGEGDEARRYYQQALEGQRQAGDRHGEATALANLGSMARRLEEFEDALEYFQQALVIFQEVGDRSYEGIVLNNIGGIYDEQGDPSQAVDFYVRALTVHHEVGDRDSQGTVLNNLASLYWYVQDWEGGIDLAQKALNLFRQVGNRASEGLTLHNLAVAHQQQGDLSQALARIEEAIAITEQLRDNIASAELRTSYFATVQRYYQLQIQLLMELHQEQPAAGYDRQAFNVSERTRARTLIELLAEANLDVSDAIDPKLHQREQALRQKLQTIDAQRVAQLQAVTDGSEIKAIVAEADRQSAKALRELDALESELRQTDPAYADLQYPEPLTVEAVQTEVLDGNTTLLQYSLGDKHSYLWVVTGESITSYTLPGREEIETAARQFYSSVNRAGHALLAARKAQVLSQLILAPAAEVLTGDRLLIVPDGILHQIPFSALGIPNPNFPADADVQAQAKAYTPLLSQYEIVNAPSSTVIATNRKIMGDRPPAPKRLAVIADPIFTANDPRVAGDRSTHANPPADDPTQKNIERALRDFDLRAIARLPNTQTEAEQILAIANGPTTAVLGVDANYDWAIANNANAHQYVHFATHGFANSNHPDLSGLILSLVDENGRPKNGFLRLTDIFNLKLPAELVVLSACQTGLGENVGGEGVVGLTRGLMYAGAERTVLSLWNVSDKKTADLMVRFYTNIWQHNQTPAAALRQAQLAMWEEGYHPYYWAAFGLQGEWQE